MLPITKFDTKAKMTACSRKLNDCFIAIHYTAGTTSKKGSAYNTACYFRDQVQASADFIVDDETIIQYNNYLDKLYCWAVGGSKQSAYGGSHYGIARNVNTISIEMCCNNDTGRQTNPNDSHWSFSDKVVNNTIELVKYLMKTYNIPIQKVIRHYDVTGKYCPGIIGWNKAAGNNENKWIEFRNKLSNIESSKVEVKQEQQIQTNSKLLYRVRKTWQDSSSQIGAFADLNNAKNACLDGYSVFDNNGNCVYSKVKTNNVPNVAMYTIKYGSTGDNVKLLQKDLNYLLGLNLTVDGIAGNNTVNAIKSFQKKYGLTQDGIYGINSYNKMKEVLK